MWSKTPLTIIKWFKWFTMGEGFPGVIFKSGVAPPPSLMFTNLANPLQMPPNANYSAMM
jgi:hypothetical protein